MKKQNTSAVVAAVQGHWTMWHTFLQKVTFLDKTFLLH